MEVTQTKTITWNLILDEQEAKWLKNLMQNAPEIPESVEDQEMRAKFWNALEVCIWN